MPSKPVKRDKVPLVYWDSCVFIGWLQKTPSRITAIDELVSMAQNNELQIITSVIAEGEVIKWPEDGITDEESNRKISEFFKNPWIVRRVVDTQVMGAVRKIRLINKLKMPDAIHVATALIHNVVALHTYDRDHLLKRTGRFSIDNKNYLRIIEPEHPNPPDHPLFDAIAK